MLIFSDSFDHYTNLTDKYEDVFNSAGMSVTGAAARTGSSGLQITAGATCVRKAVPAQTTYFCGMAFNIRALPASAVSGLMGFWNSNPQNRLLFHLYGDLMFININSSGQLIVSDQDGNGTNLGSSSAVSTGVWHYLETQVVIGGGGTGSCVVKLDGTTVINLTGLTNNGQGTTINQISFGNHPNNVGQMWIDDIYVCDTNGSTNNTFLGPVTVNYEAAIGAGAFSSFSANGAASNWQCITSDDGDTSYVLATSEGQRDSYKLSQVNVSGTIFGAMAYMRARKDDAGPRGVSIVARSATIDSPTNEQMLNTTTSMYSQAFETDPATGAPFTSASFNQLEMGVEVTT